MKRICAVFIAVFVIVAAAPVYGQPARTFDLEFRDTPLAVVLQTLARTARVNLIVEGDLAGRATLALRSITFAQALRLISATHRLTYTVREGVFIVRQTQGGAAGIILPHGAPDLLVELRVYRLRHARAEDVADALRNAVAAFMAAARPQPGAAPGGAPGPPGTPPGGAPGAPPGGVPGGPPGAPPGAAPGGAPAAPAAPAAAPGPPAVQAQQPGQGFITVVADEASNSVLVAAPAVVQIQVQAAIRALDVPPRHGAGVQGEQQNANAPAAIPPGVRADRLGPNSVAYHVRYAEPGALAAILRAEVRDITVVIDERTRQLIVTGAPRRQEAVVRLIALLDRPTPQVMMSTTVIELSETASRRLGIQWTWAPVVEIVQLVTGIVIRGTPLLEMLGNIVAAVEQGEGRVLANPSVAAADGHQAVVNMGQTLHIPVTTTVAGTVTTTLQTVNAGIRLEVTPRIIDNARLTAALNIEVNSLAGFGPGGMPIINHRAVSTQLTVADGTPIIIGGLISDITTETMRQIPILGDIPLIGELFRFRDRMRTYSHIVVTIIPRIMPVAAAVPQN